MATYQRVRGVNGRSLPFRVNCVGWYRYRIGMTNISGKCSNWADQSGNNAPLLQATAANRPTVQSDGSLSFDGVNGFMQTAFTLVQPATFYIAFAQIAWTSGKVILDGDTDAVQLAQNTSSPGIAANAGSGLTVDNTIGVGVAGGVACFVANNTASVYQAGGGAASVTTTGSGGTKNPGGVTIGADRNGANLSNIVVKELIVYSVAHDAPTRLAIMRYLGRIANVGGI